MGEIETCDVHASVDHLDEHVDVPAGGAQSAHNFGFARCRVNRLKNVLEFDAARVSTRWLASVNHCFFDDVFGSFRKKDTHAQFGSKLVNKLKWKGWKEFSKQQIEEEIHAVIRIE